MTDLYQRWESEGGSDATMSTPMIPRTRPHAAPSVGLLPLLLAMRPPAAVHSTAYAATTIASVSVLMSALHGRKHSMVPDGVNINVAHQVTRALA